MSTLPAMLRPFAEHPANYAVPLAALACVSIAAAALAGPRDASHLSSAVLRLAEAVSGALLVVYGLVNDPLYAAAGGVLFLHAVTPAFWKG